MNQVIRPKLGRPFGTFKSKHPRRPNGRSTRMFSKWVSMVQRCTNPKCKQWKWYGGRGITVCERWLGDDGFDNFFDDMGEAPPHLTLERIDNDSGYRAENCKWATMKEQAQNKRKRQSTQPNCLRQRCLRAGLPYHQIYLRINRLGWTEEKALCTPILPRGRQIGFRIPKAMTVPNAVVTTTIDEMQRARDARTIYKSPQLMGRTWA